MKFFDDTIELKVTLIAARMFYSDIFYWSLIGWIKHVVYYLLKLNLFCPSIFDNCFMIMCLKTLWIFVGFISIVLSQIDEEESFLFVTKQTINRFVVQDKEFTIKYNLYNSGPT
jgi:hypothetical protein